MTHAPLLLLSVLADSLVCHTHTASWNDPTQNIFFIIPNILWVCYYKNQFSSVAQSCLTLCDPMNCSTPGLPVHHQLPESTQTHVHWVGDAIEPSHPLMSPSLPALNPSQHQGLFKWVSSSRQMAKVGLISFRMNWMDLLAVQGTLKSLLQHHSSKASILLCSAFFIVLLSHPYMITGKTIALTRWTFVGKEMLVLYNKLSRPVIPFSSKQHRKSLVGCVSPFECSLEYPPGIHWRTLTEVNMLRVLRRFLIVWGFSGHAVGDGLRLSELRSASVHLAKVQPYRIMQETTVGIPAAGLGQGNAIFSDSVALL